MKHSPEENPPYLQVPHPPYISTSSWIIALCGISQATWHLSTVGAKMLRLVALVVLLHAVAAQSPSPDPTVLVNGGGTMSQVSSDAAPGGRGLFQTSMHDL